MKLCVLGNSHVGMLRQALVDHPRPLLDVTWFARAKDGLSGAAYKEGVVCACTPAFEKSLKRLGMPKNIVISAYDALVFVGGSAIFRNAAVLLRQHQVMDWPSGRTLSEQILEPNAPITKRAPISQAALMDTITARFQSTPSYRLIADIRAENRLPIFVVPPPLPSAEILEDPQAMSPLYRKIELQKDGAHLFAALTKAHIRAFEPLNDVVLIEQPAQTIAHGCVTKTPFMRGAVRLDLSESQPEKDVLHANADYGNLIWNEIEHSSLLS